MESLVYIEDKFVKGAEARVAALDLSVLRGFGVMDYLRTYGNEPFYLRRHLERFVASAKTLGLEVPKGLEKMEEIVHELIEMAGFDETSVKVVLTGGVSANQLLPEGPPTFFAVAYPFVPFPKKHFKKGIKVITRCYQRPFPKAKSIDYLSAIMGMKEAEKKGAVDVLFHTERGTILETGTSNFFAVKGDEVFTPKEGILEGITREVVIGLSGAIEREITLDEMSDFDGAFLTSSNKEIMPVIQIDKTVLSGGVIPLKIRELMQAFANETSSLATLL